MLSILFEYFTWHFTTALGGILSVLSNYERSIWRRFMIGQHLRTLFAPWHRSKPSDLGDVKGVGDKFINFLVDIYIRFLAAIIRLAIIGFGLITEAVILIAFILLFIVWILWPFLFIKYLIKGLALIF